MHDRRFLAAALAAGLSFAAAMPAQNHPPAPPVVNEPQVAAIVNPYDVHMETAPFADADAGDTHAASDWEIWTVQPHTLVWQAPGVNGPEKVHAHLGDGVFVGTHAGWTRLFERTNYELRVRHMDNSGAPSTQWSNWSTRRFNTTAADQVFPLELDEVAASPEPRWTDPAGQPVELPAGAVPASLRLESDTAQLLLRIDGAPQSGNALTIPGAIAAHAPVRVVLDAGSTGAPLLLPETNLAFAEHGGCRVTTLRLPAINLSPGQRLLLWASSAGATYIGDFVQVAPTFTSPARSLLPPYQVREPGYSIDLVASGLQLPVNLAFVPNAGAAPGDAKFYVVELHGAVKTVTHDGTVLTYAGNLLNYVPSGAFPGSGEQGVAGIAVDPQSGDVFVSMLHMTGGQTCPRIVRMHSLDGGLTAASQTVILDMPGEVQGQSHQISTLEIRGGLLYCHMGDGFVPATARMLSSFRGKILRLQLDGSPAPANPFYDGPPFDARDYVHALGVRNPFGGAWRALDDSRYMVENGPWTDRFAKLVIGRDYLWAGNDPDMTHYALYNWSPAVGPVNLAFVQPATFGGSGFPAGKQDHAFVTESGPTYAEGQQALGKRITEWTLDANGNLLTGPLPFVEYVGDGRASVVGLAAGPDGLYFTDLYLDLGATSPAQAGARVLRVRYGSSDDCDGNGESDWCEIATQAAPDCNHNQVLDACDLRDGTAHDFDGNGVPDECDPLSASSDTVSAGAGGRIDFALRAGTGHAGRIYLVLGSFSGTTPGLQFGAVHLPLNQDLWFMLSAGAANSAVLVNTLGLLDAAGVGSAALQVPPGLSTALIGSTLHHAFLVYDLAAAQFTLASNAVPLRLVP